MKREHSFFPKGRDSEEKAFSVDGCLKKEGEGHSAMASDKTCLTKRHQPKESIAFNEMGWIAKVNANDVLASNVRYLRCLVPLDFRRSERQYRSGECRVMSAECREKDCEVGKLSIFD